MYCCTAGMLGAGDHRTNDDEKLISVRSEVFMAVTMKNGVFWDLNLSSYFTGDVLRLRYTVQPVNAM
jgi:hypothetical protein